MLGQAYDVLPDLGAWNILPDIYYEACIRERPRSALARQCFKNYERNIVIGFSGSGGTYIPNSERKKLRALKKLAGLMPE